MTEKNNKKSDSNTDNKKVRRTTDAARKAAENMCKEQSQFSRALENHLADSGFRSAIEEINKRNAHFRDTLQKFAAPNAQWKSILKSLSSPSKELSYAIEKLEKEKANTQDLVKKHVKRQDDFFDSPEHMLSVARGDPTFRTNSILVELQETNIKQAKMMETLATTTVQSAKDTTKYNKRTLWAVGLSIFISAVAVCVAWSGNLSSDKFDKAEIEALKGLAQQTEQMNGNNQKNLEALLEDFQKSQEQNIQAVTGSFRSFQEENTKTLEKLIENNKHEQSDTPVSEEKKK